MATAPGDETSPTRRGWSLKNHPPSEVASRMQSMLAEVFSSGTNADVRQASTMPEYIAEGRLIPRPEPRREDGLVRH